MRAERVVSGGVSGVGRGEESGQLEELCLFIVL